MSNLLNQEVKLPFALVISFNKLPPFPRMPFRGWSCFLRTPWLIRAFFPENKNRLFNSPTRLRGNRKTPCFFFFLFSLQFVSDFLSDALSVSPPASFDVALSRRLCLDDEVIQPSRPVDRSGLSGSKGKKMFSPPSDSKQPRRRRRRPCVCLREWFWAKV